MGGLGIGIGAPWKTLSSPVYPLPTNGFDPTSVSGLKVWLAADHWQSNLFTDSSLATPVAKDNDPIGGWKDLSSVGNNPVQATAGNRPLFSLGGGVNGLPGVLFNGTSNYLQHSYGSSLSQPSTAFFVCFFTHNNEGFVIDGLSGARNAFGIEISSNDINMYAGTALGYVDTGPVSGQWTTVFNGASSILRKNGSQVASGNAGTQAASGLTVGADFAPGDYFQGYIHEILIYNANITGSNLTNIEGYLANKWGVP